MLTLGVNVMLIFELLFLTVSAVMTVPQIKVFNNLLLVTDSGDSAVLLHLDLTAAFDTADHNILISRLEHWRIKAIRVVQWSL